MKKLFKRISNRGSTFVIVITTIGFVGVLTSLVLMITSSGYQTKSIDNQAKNNFYSAEEIVDQIKTGLHNDMSKAIMSAYFSTLTTYNNGFVSASTSAERKALLNTVKKLYRQRAIGTATTGFIGMIKDNSAAGNVVNISHLEKYISDAYLGTKDPHVKIVIGTQKKAGNSQKITYEFDGTNYDYIVIRNIGITYTNELGYTNNVYTDIKMNIPDINFDFLDLDRNLDFAEYAFMAKNDVVYNVSGSNPESAVMGSFFVGNDFNITGAAKFKALSDYGYIGGDLNLVSNTSTLAAPSKNTNGYTHQSMFEMNILTDYNGYYQGAFYHRYKKASGTYSASTFNVKEQLASLRSKKGTAAYERDATNNIKQMYKSSSTKTNKLSFNDTYLTVNGILMSGSGSASTKNMINTDTNLLVHNDMSFNLDYAHADIMNTYHGYGYSTENLNDASVADDSSSIILNNKNCILNMNLRTLSILGAAYIKTNATDTSYSHPYAASDVRTGDSLIVRGNQIAYLVPARYVPTFQTNPVTLEEAQSALGASANLEAFASQIMNEVKNQNPSLYNTYFKPYNQTNFVKPIFYSYVGSGTDYVVYYYFNFANPALAADYYNNAKHNGTPLVSDVTKETLLGLIPATINVKVDSLSQDYIMGNYITDLKSNETGIIGSGTPPYSMGKGGASSNTTAGVLFAKNVANIRSFLRKEIPKKIEDNDAILQTYKSRDAIGNIVDWDLIEAEPYDNVLNANYNLNGFKCKIVVTRASNYVIDNNGIKETILLITTGNVEIRNNSYVSGLIIAGGKKQANGTYARGNITIGKGVTFDADEETIADVFRNAAMYRTGGHRYFNKLFRGFDYDNTAGMYIPLETSNGTIIDLNGMFTYENWSRQ